MKLQEGIYYGTKTSTQKTFCVISLRVKNSYQIREVGAILHSISKRLTKLKRGIIEGLEVDAKHRKTGSLTVLLGYGPKVFEVSGSKKRRPVAFGDNWNFKPPNSSGGGQLLDTSSILYSPRVTENHLLFDHVLLQFIADDEFYTNRAVVEVWRELHKQKKVRPHMPLRISGLYSGFQRDDQRSWLGFHDGVSNLKSHERAYVIPISARNLSIQDRWTINGTYLAFMRIAIDLEKWEETTQGLQEIIIGRDKLTGCPLVRVDKNRKPVKDTRCPVPGTSEIIDPGNENFRDHPPYTANPHNKILQLSHIGSSRPIDQIPILDKKSLRIYRQGFEFLVSTNDPPGFVAGLNFVSFQNTPERLHRALAYQQMISQSTTGVESVPTLDRFFSVLAAGIFFVPPVAQEEPFPGAQIFFSSTELRLRKFDNNLTR